MKNQRQTLFDVAPTISGAVSEILREHRLSDGRLRAFYYHTLKHMIRHLEGFLVTAGVSEAAQEIADANGIGDLRKFRWGHQPNRMRDKGRQGHCQGNGDYLYGTPIEGRRPPDFARHFGARPPSKYTKKPLYLVALTVPDDGLAA